MMFGGKTPKGSSSSDLYVLDMSDEVNHQNNVTLITMSVHVSGAVCRTSDLQCH